MGISFSNVHIQKNDSVTEEALKSYIVGIMNEQGCVTSEDGDDEDISAVINIPKGSDWASFAINSVDFSNAETMKAFAEKVSKAFSSDVIAACCVDSDFMTLDLIDSQAGTDGWINIGKPYSGRLPRRTSAAAWKAIVSDYTALKDIIKKSYACAEEAFFDIATLIGMNAGQCTTDAENADGDVITLHFKMPEGRERKKPAVEIWHASGMPCRIGEQECVHAVSKGARSKGVGVIIAGDFVKNDEITFENVRFEWNVLSENYASRDITFRKVLTMDGSYILLWEDAGFRIPAAVNEDLPEMKKMSLEGKKLFGIRFTPQGNPRKLLDIKVFIFPLESRQNGDCWFCWRYSGSKEQFIKEFNETWGYDPKLRIDPDEIDL